MFPEKVASVTPIDKKTDEKNSVLNFHPISVLNCLSQVHENILKTQLVEKMTKIWYDRIWQKYDMLHYSYLKSKKQHQK